MTRLLHDHAGTGLCAVAPTGRVLGVSGMFLRALGLGALPHDAMLHHLLPLPEGCGPCAGWHWLLDSYPDPATPLPRPSTTRGGVRGSVLVRTLTQAEASAIPHCPDLRDTSAYCNSASGNQPLSDARTGVLLQLHAPDLPGLADTSDVHIPACPSDWPDEATGTDAPALPGGASAAQGSVAGPDCRPTPLPPLPTPPLSTPIPSAPIPSAQAPSPSVPDMHLRQALDALSVGLAHDFGNVVASILGFAEIAVSRLHAVPDGPPAPPASDPMVVRSLDNIIRGCQRAREVIAFAQSIAGRVDLNAEPADLHALVTTWCAELADTLPPDARWAVSCGMPAEHATAPGGQDWQCPGAPSSLRLPPDRPPHTLPLVLVDTARLREAFAEIWHNAAWAVQDAHAHTSAALTDITNHAGTTGQQDSFAGRILVETTLAQPTPRFPGLWVRVRVRDTGRGMDADTLCRMRDPYFSTKARHEGKGRGLSRAVGIVRAHGGQLDIAAGPGLGCMVDILLPVASKA